MEGYQQSGERRRDRNEEQRTLGEVRDEASKIVGLLLSSFDDLDERVQVTLNCREEPGKTKRTRRGSVGVFVGDDVEEPQTHFLAVSNSRR